MARPQETAPGNVFKIVLVGDPNVGKTSLIMRYAENKFSDETMTTIGQGLDYKTKEITIDKKRIQLQLWDTAGQERFRSITDSFYKGAHGLLLVFDVTDTESYSQLTEIWFRDLERYLYQRPNIVKYLVANKIDEKQTRVINAKAAKELADTVEMTYMETSAKDDINVTQTFESLARDILRAGLLGGDSYEEQLPYGSRNIQIRKTQGDSGSKSKCCLKS